MSASATTWGEGRRVEAVASRREWKGGGACACFEYTLVMALMILAHGITAWGRRSLGSVNRKTCEVLVPVMGGAEPIPYWPCFSFGFALLTPRAKTVRSAYYSSTLEDWRSQQQRPLRRTSHRPRY